MKNLLVAVITIACLSCSAPQQSTSNPAPVDTASGNYLGIKVGGLNISRDLGYNNGTSVGALFGHDFPGNDFAFELEMTGTVSPAEGTATALGDLDVFTLAAYGVYRTPGALYFKAKAGLVYEYFNVDLFGLPIEGDAIGLSLGIGGGYRINDGLALELEYTAIEADIDLISLGLNFAL